MAILYTATATATGGREGHAQSSDGNLDVALALPKELGGPGGAGTNPEQLFAAGYAACFESAMRHVARGKKIPITSASVTAQVGIGPSETGPGFGLAVHLTISLPDLEPEVAQNLIEEAHQVCPYSNATRNNILVELTLA
ncbi:hypothetical protein CCAX7_11720 [Capsulimonas corticalis]|uniref:Uncharacterized protein n=1 Tax=Capsulimonas corticalis TaxID=2219043 RepID=A0A402D771_9BACT|nr:organic hydroperoxide resistance protein [Capsulimonas corticalis]BDI29121.1 hypothetical protein CCAX7_11720 [Capsulimonas corticalis]